jgi:hypothetical protein
MNNVETTQNLPLYPRIVAYTDATHGEFMFCPCGERNAVCPDCGSEVCVFCDSECPSCGTPVF